ncbi:FecR family protein [Mangrovibacterium lignilyticum]|uniref:FecR family protein n=1 Tax=Mangrovibacterium lignilyticum TaxID=2668052 RepID=UPI0013D66D7D|nr:FecR domain-containing protein [Mangrovibacterium lignilyticum]
MPKRDKIKMILRQLNGESSPAERDKFSNWLMENPENLDQYIELKEIWNQDYTRSLPFDENKALKRIQAAAKKKKRRIPLPKTVLRIAAILAIILVSGAYLVYQQNIQPAPVSNPQIATLTKTSGPGEQMRVTLPDGSVIWLNGESTVSYPEKFLPGCREVTLTGEAFFEVTKNPAQPFVVQTGKVSTTVLGTSFNIKAFTKNEATVTVATGKVRVAHTSDNSQTDELYLLPNEQAVWSAYQNGLQKNTVDSRDYYAWKNGTICFNNETLPEAMQMLERWYNVTIKLKAANAENRRYINGNYKDKKLYNILDGLCYIYNLEYEYLNDSTILIKEKIICEQHKKLSE